MKTDDLNIKNHISPEKLGFKLRQLRDNKNWSQEQLARKLGITDSAYGKIERAETVINLNQINALAEVYNMGSDELIGGEPKGNLEIKDNTLRFGKKKGHKKDRN